MANGVGTRMSRGVTRANREDGVEICWDVILRYTRFDKMQEQSLANTCTLGTMIEEMTRRVFRRKKKPLSVIQPSAI